MLFGLDGVDTQLLCGHYEKKYHDKCLYTATFMGTEVPMDSSISNKSSRAKRLVVVIELAICLKPYDYCQSNTNICNHGNTF